MRGGEQWLRRDVRLLGVHGREVRLPLPLRLGRGFVRDHAFVRDEVRRRGHVLQRGRLLRPRRAVRHGDLPGRIALHSPAERNADVHLARFRVMILRSAAQCEIAFVSARRSLRIAGAPGRSSVGCSVPRSCRFARRRSGARAGGELGRSTPRRRLRARPVRWAIGLTLLFTARGAIAQTPPPSEQTEAYTRFEKGLALLNEGAVEAALAEFLASRKLEPTRGNTQNAAVCLNRLGRYDEALDLLEDLLRESATLDEADRRRVMAQADELRKRVGSVEVDTLEPGAFVLVDGRLRGKTPLSNPVRLAAGSHGVKIVGEGLEPYETRVDVAGQQRVVLSPRLVASMTTGRMTVVELSGKPATVLLDSAPVGATPWVGVVAPGVHAVALRGEGRLGAQPVNAVVRAAEHATVRLALEPLDADVRIVPSPASARVALDGVELGHGIRQATCARGHTWSSRRTKDIWRRERASTPRRTGISWCPSRSSAIRARSCGGVAIRRASSSRCARGCSRRIRSAAIRGELHVGVLAAGPVRRRGERDAQVRAVERARARAHPRLREPHAADDGARCLNRSARARGERDRDRRRRRPVDDGCRRGRFGADTRDVVLRRVTRDRSRFSAKSRIGAKGTSSLHGRVGRRRAARAEPGGVRRLGVTERGDRAAARRQVRRRDRFVDVAARVHEHSAVVYTGRSDAGRRARAVALQRGVAHR